MTTLARLKTWVTGDVLTASDLNNEFNNIINDYNGSINHANLGTIRNVLFSNSTSTDTIDITSSSTGASVVVRNGGDAFELSGTGLIKFGGANNSSWVSNLGFTYTVGTGVFKITDVSGADLSTTNPAWVNLPSTTAGQRVCLKTTAATHTFTDDNGASNIVGEEFGATSGIAWNQDRVFYLYAVNADNTDANLKFAISPNPCATSSPSSGNNCGYQGVPAVTPSDSNFFFLTSTNITATHNNKPCLCIGSFRMRMSSSDDWTVQTLANNDGIGLFNEQTLLTMPLAQMGAATGTYMWANGGTAPLFTTNNYKFRLDKSGRCYVAIYLDSDPGTDGAGAVEARCALPYKSALNYDVWAGTTVVKGAGLAGEEFDQINIIASQNYFRLYEVGGTVVNNSSFSNGVRYIVANFNYQAF